MPPSPWDSWQEVGTAFLRAKKQTGDASVQEREYALLQCPLGCGTKVEVLKERLTKLRSIACRAHLRHCPMLQEGQRATFKVARETTGVRKKHRQSLPAPPAMPEDMTAEEYIKSFAYKPPTKPHNVKPRRPSRGPGPR